MVRLIVENNKETVHRIESNLGMAIMDICISMYRNEWKQYILGRIIANRPRGIGKVNTWWYNVFRISKVLFEFGDNMKKEYDIISSPLHYDYGHYFVKEKE